ncbi:MULTISPECIES: hypothetical protein [Streptomyces]|uniref:Uncharacterized protein n=1 Tax=Streptomyces doudnae TaxID=3075536 RepID=A0ABD5EHN4_9ACTN|nr:MULTISPECIES: hypothetical protein [unclassified Streptomyces]MDT0433800.1 hypothetical protein [Streptomyces sp. DSM 41981]MYQ68487.1 hypothetical protein [Streptomyces sp. SID4950]
MDEHPLDVAAFLNDIEGHLLLTTARREADAAAARFTASLGWATEAQRADLRERFEAEYRALLRAQWTRTADRGRELRAEYEERYRVLRGRLLAVFLLGCALLTASAALVAAG